MEILLMPLGRVCHLRKSMFLYSYRGLLLALSSSEGRTQKVLGEVRKEAVLGSTHQWDCFPHVIQLAEPKPKPHWQLFHLQTSDTL